jgi:hypothetical protein
MHMRHVTLHVHYFSVGYALYLYGTIVIVSNRIIVRKGRRATPSFSAVDRPMYSHKRALRKLGSEAGPGFLIFIGGFQGAAQPRAWDFLILFVALGGNRFVPTSDVTCKNDL